VTVLTVFLLVRPVISLPPPRLQDIRKPGSVNQDPIFTNNKLPDGEVGYPGGIFDPLGYSKGNMAELNIGVNMPRSHSCSAFASWWPIMSYQAIYIRYQVSGTNCQVQIVEQQPQSCAPSTRASTHVSAVDVLRLGWGCGSPVWTAGVRHGQRQSNVACRTTSSSRLNNVCEYDRRDAVPEERCVLRTCIMIQGTTG
jgi:hypothetical protein